MLFHYKKKLIMYDHKGEWHGENHLSPLSVRSCQALFV